MISEKIFAKGDCLDMSDMWRVRMFFLVGVLWWVMLKFQHSQKRNYSKSVF